MPLAEAKSVAFIEAGRPAATVAAGERYEALDALRGVAALMVVLFHCEILSHLNDWTLVRRGEAFVDFFFVLSGFVIARAYAGRLGSGTDLCRFALLRVGRVWPLHAVMLALFIAVEIVKAFVPAFGAGGDPAFSGANAPSFILSNLLLVQAFGLDGALSWNTPAWSISAEIAAYAVFAFFVYLGGRRWPLFMAATLAVALFVLALDAEGMATTARLGAARAIFGFAAGALLAGATRGDRKAGAEPGNFVLATIAELAAATLVVLLAFVPEGDWRTFLAPAGFVIAVHVFAREGGALSALLRTRPFVALGGLSYGVYMVHMFINLRLLNVASLADKAFAAGWRLPAGEGPAFAPKLDFGGAWAGDLATLALIAFVVVLAALAKRYIEDPGRALARRLAARL